MTLLSFISIALLLSLSGLDLTYPHLAIKYPIHQTIDFIFMSKMISAENAYA